MFAKGWEVNKYFECPFVAGIMSAVFAFRISFQPMTACDRVAVVLVLPDEETEVYWVRVTWPVNGSEI